MDVITTHKAVASRLARLRALMAERGYDAVLLRNNADLRWLTGAARVFDDEVAHTALVTHEGAWLHTDGRYFGMFEACMGPQSGWVVDQEREPHSEWAAEKIRELRLRMVAIEDTVTLGFYESLTDELNTFSCACLMPRLHGDLALMRVVKDAQELVALREAQRITDATFDHLCGFIRPGQTELAIRAELEAFMLSQGAHGLSFETIVASGPNGANPHARPGERVVQEGDLIVMDYGALYDDYHADMTRTVCVGVPSARQRDAYDVVRRAHETCAQAARPHMLGKELHELAASVIDQGGYEGYFNHGLGHGVGLEIHERPSVGRVSEDVLCVGSVFTIEPGVYVPGEFGIRLEDTGVMGEDGFHPFATSTHELVSV